MNKLQVISPPTNVWLTRLRQGHIVYGPKEQQFMRIKYGWEPFRDVWGSISVSPMWQVDGSRHIGQPQEWNVYPNGTGFDGVPILLPIKDHCPKRSRTSLKGRIAYAQKRRFKTYKKRKRTTGKLSDWIGADWTVVRQHIVGQFEAGMARKNYAISWNVDHIRPLASFDLSDPEQASQAWHFSNLRPMWIRDHDEKHHKRVA